METTGIETVKGSAPGLESSEDLAFKDVPAHKFAMAVLGQNGDTKHIWDPEKPAEVEAAKAVFDSLRKKGYMAFHVKGKQGEQGDQMREFDPAAGRLILVPQMAGG